MARKALPLQNWDSAPRSPKKKMGWAIRQVNALLSRRESVGASYQVLPGEYMPDGKAVTANNSDFEDTLKCSVWQFLGIEEDPLPGIKRERTFA